jgi:fumarate hydratase class II
VLLEIKQQVSLLEDYLEQYRQSMISGLEIQQGAVKDKVKLKKKISAVAKIVNYDKTDIVDAKNQLNQLMKDLV